MDLIMAETPLGWTLIHPKPKMNPPTKRQRVESKVERVTRANSSHSKLQGLPLARVKLVKPGSPAELSTVRKDDLLISVGPVSATTKDFEGEVPNEFRRSKDRNISVKIA